MSLQIFDIPNTSGKAKNHVNGDINYLYSYNTKVAEYNKRTNKMQVLGWYSVTTGKHINEFLQLFGYPKQTKKELFKTYNLTK